MTTGNAQHRASAPAVPISMLRRDCGPNTRFNRWFLPWFRRHRAGIMPSMLSEGMIQVYTGPGKGKTTAALGLALRAAGRGLRVLICQFLKPPSLELGERTALAALPTITLRTATTSWNMRCSLDDPPTRDRVRTEIRQTLDQLAATVANAACDVLILDEINYCLAHGLADWADVHNLLIGRDRRVEVVLTGRDAPPELIEMADLVTEMHSRKHPYDNGTAARKGIEY